MTQPNYTEICVLVDRSGSMTEIKEATEAGFANFIAEQRALPGKCQVTLCQFDNIVELTYEGQLIGEVPSLKLIPRNSTALLDAMGKTIDRFGRRLSDMSEEERPDRVVFVVATDGLENASQQFTREIVFEKVQHQQEVYSWEFLYLGANQDAIAVGESIGIRTGNSITYTGANAQAAWAATSRALSNVRAGVATGYSDEDRELATATTATPMSPATK